MLNDASSMKASYSRTNQYLQLAQNSTGGNPMDVWFTASSNVEPQLADQFAVGYFRNFSNNMFETSVEVYYKKMQNTIDFRDHAELIFNEHLEGELRYGESEAYGIEFLVKKVKGKLSGWVSYTYSYAEREIKEINFGNPYPAPYDKPNDISFVSTYELNKRWTFGATWVYSTGSPITFPISSYETGNLVLPIYSKRNSYRMPDYHRLDISISFKNKEKPNRAWNSEWNLSIYNAYNRHNAWAINFVSDEANSRIKKSELTYLFPILPTFILL